MTCERYPDPIDAERYVSGEMTEPEQSAFEEHFFSCDVCFQRVRELQLVQAALPPGTGTQPAQRRSTAWLVGLSAAAVLVIAVAAWQGLSRTNAPAESPRGGSAATGPQPGGNDAPSPAHARRTALSALALVTPPSFTPLTTRGRESTARRQFDAAMVKDVAGQYADAETGLSAAVTSAPELAPAQFYLGVSRLLQGHPADARPALAAAASLGVSPWSEEAHFYLAKAALAQDDVETATTELDDRRSGWRWPGGRGDAHLDRTQ